MYTYMYIYIYISHTYIDIYLCIQINRTIAAHMRWAGAVRRIAPHHSASVQKTIPLLLFTRKHLPLAVSASATFSRSMQLLLQLLLIGPVRQYGEEISRELSAEYLIGNFFSTRTLYTWETNEMSKRSKTNCANESQRLWACGQWHGWDASRDLSAEHLIGKILSTRTLYTWDTKEMSKRSKTNCSHESERLWACGQEYGCQSQNLIFDRFHWQSTTSQIIQQRIKAALFVSNEHISLFEHVVHWKSFLIFLLVFQ